MGAVDLLVGVLVGVVQGVFEWLPLSSEGLVVLVLTALEVPPATAVKLALVLHAGTAVAATVYYRSDLATYLGRLPQWRPQRAFDADLAELSFLALATGVSAVVGLAGYWLLLENVTELSGGAFIALIGGLLVLTGVVQRLGTESVLPEPEVPGALDAVLVGVGQGLAVLPGISRSGTTVSLLLLRGYDGETAFDLSFILAIPASLGAGILAFSDAGDAAGLAPEAMAVAFLASGFVGYLTIDGLLRLVRRIEFWGVCVGFGGLAVLGGAAVILV